MKRRQCARPNWPAGPDLGRRRVTLGLGALALAPVAWSVPAAGQRQAESEGGGLRGTQREGTIAPIPIAVHEFFGEDPRFASEVMSVVAGDLERSGLFRPLDPA